VAAFRRAPRRLSALPAAARRFTRAIFARGTFSKDSGTALKIFLILLRGSDGYYCHRTFKSLAVHIYRASIYTRTHTYTRTQTVAEADASPRAIRLQQRCEISSARTSTLVIWSKIFIMQIGIYVLRTLSELNCKMSKLRRWKSTTACELNVCVVFKPKTTEEKVGICDETFFTSIVSPVKKKSIQQ